MGQCGCGEVPVEKAYPINRGCVMGLQIYRGCEDCFQGPGVSLLFFNSKKSEWLECAEFEDAPKPDEYGGNGGRGISFGLFEVEDLRAEARELWKEARIGRGGDNYANLDDWLADYGWQMVSGALRRFEQRMEAQRAEIASRNPEAQP